MQRILDLRKFERESAETELGKANAEVARIQRELRSIAETRAATIKKYNTVTDLKVQSDVQSYFFFLDQRQKCFLEDLAKAELVAAEKREVVRLAMQKVKVLENLKNSKIKEWKSALLKEEELATDDIVTSSTHNKLTM